jgi:hypothetical protein
MCSLTTSGTSRYLSVSTVLQKFLDTAHMDLLKQYLEAVAANDAVMRPAYAAVLLCLYVQLRDQASLRRFINDSIGESGYRWNEEEAIATCLNGSLYPRKPLRFFLAVVMHIVLCSRVFPDRYPRNMSVIHQIDQLSSVILGSFTVLYC